MPENRSKTGQFKPGTSPNPGGRPKGLAAAREYIEAKTKGGQALVDFRLSVLAGKPVHIPGDDGEDKLIYPTIRDMEAAAQALEDRLWGKAVQAVAGNDGEPISIQIIRTVTG